MGPLQPVSHHSANHTEHAKQVKERMLPSTVFLALVLAVTLVGLGQRGLYDLNRLYNPHYLVCNQASYLLSAGESCPTEQYAFRQVLLHSYLSFPLFIFFLGLVLILRKHKLNTWQKALWRVSAAVAIYFGVEFLVEVIIYLFQFHRIVGWYVSLTTAAILLSALVVLIEVKKAKKGGGHH